MTADVVPIRKFEKPEALEPKVIGALLNNGSHLRGLLSTSGLSEESFSRPLSRMAWRLVSMLVGLGRGVSAVEVISFGRLRRAFSPADEAELERLELENVITPEQLGQVLDDLRANRRATGLSALLRSTADAIDSKGVAPDAVWQTLSAAKNLLQEEAPDQPVSADNLQLLDKWERNERSGKSLLVPTGIKVVDEMIGGYPHNLTIIAGDPGTGKNGFIASGIRAQLLADPTLRIGVAALEDGTEWLTNRWMAADTGILLREIGWKKRTDEQRAACEASAQASHGLLERVDAIRLNRIRIPDLIRKLARWKRVNGIGMVYIDNASQFELRTPGARFEQPFELLANGLEDLRQWAIDEGCGLALLMHTNEEAGAKKKPGPPAGHMLRGGRASDQKTRLLLGLWKKGTSWRCTMVKGNSLGESGETVELERIPAAAMIVPEGGRRINLEQEAAIERREVADAKAAERADLEVKRKALVESKKHAAAEAKKAAEEAAKVEAIEKAKPPQAALPLEGA